MTIHIIDNQPDIYLTRSEHDRLQSEYQRFCMFNADPPSFEEFVRAQRNRTVGAGTGTNPAKPWSQS